MHGTCAYDDFWGRKFRSILLVIGCCPPLDTLSTRRGCLAAYEVRFSGRIGISSGSRPLLDASRSRWGLNGPPESSNPRDVAGGRNRESPCPPSRVAPARQKKKRISRGIQHQINEE